MGLTIKKILVQAVMLVMFWLPALANDTLRTVLLEKDSFRVLGIGGEVGIWEDPQRDSDTLTIGDVLYAPAGIFKLWKKERFRFGFTREAHWFRLDVTDTIDRELLLELDNPYLEEVRFYQVLDGEIADTVILGSSFPFGERTHRNLQFSISVPANDTVHCFFYIPYHRYQLDFRLFLWDKEIRAKASSKEALILIVFFCLIFVFLLILGIAIYLTRFRYFWYYFLYVLLVSAFIYSDTGLSFMNFWPDYPYLQQVAIPVLANAYLIAGTLFVLSHFSTRRRYPFHDSALRVVMYIAGGMMPLALALPFVPPYFSHLFSYFHSVMYIITCVLFFWLVAVAIMRKDRQFPGWLLVGFLIHGMNVIYSSLESFKIVPPLSLTQTMVEHNWLLTFHTPLMLMVGLMVEMGIVLYIGMKRFKIMYAETQAMSKEVARQKQEKMNALVLGMESEQQRIARELHDGLGSGLSAVKFKLERLKESNDQNGISPEALNEAVKDLSNLHRDLRDIAHNLMPKPLYKLGFLPALEQLIHRMQAADPNLQIHLYNNMELKDINQLSKIYLFRIVQELLNNLFKHAKATEAWLQYVQHEDKLLITLEDNGKGFDTSLMKQKNGIGLSNIRYRVEDALGGTFSIESTPGKGTMVTIEVPYKSLLEGKENLFPKDGTTKKRSLKALITGKND